MTQRVLAVVPEILPKGDARVGGDVLHRRGLGGRRRHDDGLFQGPELIEGIHDPRHRGAFLADRDVDRDDVIVPLVDDGIQRDGRLSGLPVADDKLPLAPADGGHGIDGLDPGLERLLDRLAVDDAGGLDLDGAILLGLDRALPVDRLTEGVNNPAQQRFPDRHLGDTARPLDDVALLDVPILAENGRADVILLEVQNHSVDLSGKLQELPGHRLFKAVDTGDAVAHIQDGPGLADLEALFVFLYLLLKYTAYFFSPDFHVSLYAPS